MRGKTARHALSWCAESRYGGASCVFCCSCLFWSAVPFWHPGTRRCIEHKWSGPIAARKRKTALFCPHTASFSESQQTLHFNLLLNAVMCILLAVCFFLYFGTNRFQMLSLVLGYISIDTIWSSRRTSNHLCRPHLLKQGS